MSDLDELESDLRYAHERGLKSDDRSLLRKASKRELVALIFRLFKEVKQPRIGGIKLIKGPEDQVPMKVQRSGSEGRAHHESLVVTAVIPGSDEDVWVGVSPHEERIEINAGWESDVHPVIRTQLYEDEMSAGSSRNGEEFHLPRISQGE